MKRWESACANGSARFTSATRCSSSIRSNGPIEHSLWSFGRSLRGEEYTSCGESRRPMQDCCLATRSSMDRPSALRSPGSETWKSESSRCARISRPDRAGGTAFNTKKNESEATTSKRISGLPGS